MSVGGCFLVQGDSDVDELFDRVINSDDGGGAVVSIEVEEVE